MTDRFRLIDDLSLAKGNGRIAARMKSLARVDLLNLDDWGLEPLDGKAQPEPVPRSCSDNQR